MITRFRGRIDRQETSAYLDAILADPANDDCDELIILEDVDMDEIGSSDVRSLARRAAELSRDDRFRVCVVAPRDADFGMWRMFQSFRNLGDDRMAVFRNLRDACDWLGTKWTP